MNQLTNYAIISEKFFSNKINDIVLSIQTIIENESITDETNYDSVIETRLDSFSPLTSNQIKKLISNSSTKSCSLDPIPTVLLKKLINVLIDPITFIINKSLTSGRFPSIWKSAVVTPILKKQNLEPIYANFRPITNLSYISKLTEKAALESLIPYLKSTNKFATNNSGYQHFHSTETLITKISSDILSNMDKQEVTILVLLDLSAAFDTVNHNKMMEILEKYFGLSGGALGWMQSYFTDRTQKIKLKDSLSKEFNLNHGVPQGSCIGPIAFLIYISALYNLVQEHTPTVLGYADDHQIYLSFKPSSFSSTQHTITSVEFTINKMRSFMLKHSLKINDSKTEILAIGTRQQLTKIQNFSIRVGNCNVESKQSALNLGITFDSHFNLKEHITNTRKKCQYHLYRIKQIRPYLNITNTEILIHSFVISTLDYCNTLYSNLPKVDLRRLQSIQNQAARIITGARKYDRITPVLRSLHWLPVDKRSVFKTALLTYKTLNGMAPSYMENYIKKYTPARTLRSSYDNKLVIPEIKREIGSRAFAHAAPTIWNSLPHHVRSSASVAIFKKRLKTHLFLTLK